MTPEARARLHEQHQQLRFQLLNPRLSNDAYWRLYDQAEEIAAQLGQPVSQLDPRCEPPTVPKPMTRADRLALLAVLQRAPKDSVGDAL